MFFSSDNIYYMCLFVCCLSHAYLFDTVVRLLSTNLLPSFLLSFFYFIFPKKPKEERNGYVFCRTKNRWPAPAATVRAGRSRFAIRRVRLTWRASIGRQTSLPPTQLPGWQVAPTGQ
jgi:hypothetical protein